MQGTLGGLGLGLKRHKIVARGIPGNAFEGVLEVIDRQTAGFIGSLEQAASEGS